MQVSDKHAVVKNEAVAKAIADAEAALGDNGRVLVRPSGTEPLVRVMVEAADDDAAKLHVQAIADVVREEMGA